MNGRAVSDMIVVLISVGIVYIVSTLISSVTLFILCLSQNCLPLISRSLVSQGFDQIQCRRFAGWIITKENSHSGRKDN